MVDLSVPLGGGLTLANPVMPASGTIAEAAVDLIDFDLLGAIVAKTITPEIREGNPPPRVAELRDGMIASIGIPSKGPAHFVAETVPFWNRFRAPLVASISAGSVEAFAALAAEISVPGVAAIELNISCPNLKANGRAFGMDPVATAAVVAAVKANTALPVWPKLTPNVGDITEIARAAEGEGADALVVANAMLAMAIDTETFRPRLGNVMGGITGPATRPVILRMAYQCAKAVTVPIIGCGGIGTVQDAAEYMLAGCSAVQVGTASFVRPRAMTDLVDGLADYLQRHGLRRAVDLVGAMQDGALPDHPEWEAAV